LNKYRILLQQLRKDIQAKVIQEGIRKYHSEKAFGKS